MSNVIKNPRNGCALHGALQTVQEINGAVPVVHSNAGCGVVNYLANQRFSGGASSYSGFSIPGTAAQERHVIFGGASRLREQIKNTIKVQKGDLYVILNSCESAMVGDDVDAMTREIVEQGEPVVDTLVAGFNGGPHYGYEQVLGDIFKSIYEVKKSDLKRESNLVNIFGIVPQKDPYWQGNLNELQRILTGLGIKSNVFFGTEGGVADFVNAKNASASIVFSKWGELPAKILNEKFDIPVIYRPSLPIGTEKVQDLAEAINKVISLDESLVKDFLEKEEHTEKSLLFRVRDEIFELGLSKNAVIIGDEEQVIRLGSFLKDRLGVVISSVVLIDSLKKDEAHETNNEEVLRTISENIYKGIDQKEIDEIVSSSNVEVIFGSSLEKGIAEKLNLPLVEISYPIADKLILNKADAGVNGAISLLENYITVVKQYDERKKELASSILKEVKGGESWRELSQKKNFLRQSNLITELPTREYISAQR